MDSDTQCIFELEDGLFTCQACDGSRSMQSKSLRKHLKSPKHLNNFEQCIAEKKAATVSSTSASARSNHNHLQTEIENEEEPDHNYENEASPNKDFPNEILDIASDQDSPEPKLRNSNALLDLWAQDHSHLFQSPVHHVNSMEDEPICEELEASNSDDDGEDSNDEGEVSEPDCHQSQANLEDECSWAPFSSLAQFVGLLILGSTRTTMSQLCYERVRSFIALLNIKLSSYKTLQHLRKRLKQQYDMMVYESLSPLHKPCFGLRVKDILKQELANPYVRDHLKFIPELPIRSSKINRLSQSKKWCEQLDPDLRVQMIDRADGHFHLFELVQRKSKQIVIPFYFYRSGYNLSAKCVFAKIRKSGHWGISKIRIEFTSVTAFDCEALSTINVDKFWKVFDKIKLREGVLVKDHYEDVMYESKTCGHFSKVALYNTWRQKAKGKVIRNIPLVLYCDYLSGNISKRWNKHLAFYCTLAGLPPKLGNQEYNCHFLTTSNTAGALELADPLIDKLNFLATEGFVAYDSKIDAEIFVMTSIICHLGDSSMHAEVTNMMNPTTLLSPCRICRLKVDKLVQKQSTKYVCEFLEIDKDGHKLSLPTRDWSETIKGSKELWKLSKLTGSITIFDMKSALWGLRDTLNVPFVKRLQNMHQDPSVSNEEVVELYNELNAEFGDRLFNPFVRLKGFDRHCDTPVEVLHVILLGVVKYLLRHQMQSATASEKNNICGRWRSFDKSGLNVPPIQPKTMIQHFLSLTWKEFRVVLQCSPFIFAEFCDLSNEEHVKWTAISNLAPYIFQTETNNMEAFTKELDQLIQHFLKSIVQLTAQWCNKPKFHKLIHLCHSIRTFGPAVLLATENFDGYNGNTRKSSIMSNHLSPSRDIANSFNNHWLI